MTLQQFLNDYFCRVTIQNQGNVNLVVTTEAVRRIDNKVIDAVRTSIDIQETNDWIVDSNSMISVTPWDWNKLVEQAKRAQLDYFAQRAPIDNYYPMDSSVNTANMYI
jgi:hypothetical protein